MNLGYLDSTCKRLLALALVAAVTEGCDNDKKDKRSNNPPPAAACSEGLADGQSQSLTLYRKDLAPFGTTCNEQSFAATATCKAGVTNFSEAGSESCEETVLSSITLSSDIKEVEVGQTFSLKLEGVNQLNEKIVIDGTKATWTSSNSIVTISESGVISSTAIANDVTITAKVGELTAQYKLNIIGKSCDQTLNGATREFTLYPKATIAFNATCEASKVQVKCENGTFLIPQDQSETCTKATLKGLTAEPASLSLFASEARQINLFVVDTIGTKIAVPADQATWTVPAGAKVTLANGTITALERIVEKFEITAAAHGFTTPITVGPQAKLEGFEQKDVLMKEGDELTLTVKADQAVEAKEMNWESSNPELVSVELGKIKALKPDGVATITAKLDKQTITVEVSVEAALKITSEAVYYADDQIARDGSISVKLITADMPKFIAYRTTVAGPAQEKEPILATPTEGCKFSLLAAQKNWDLQVELVEDQEVLPANCEVEVQLTSKAGQKLNEKFKIPVDYSRISMTELPQVQGPNGLELARVEYKLSSNITAPTATVNVLRKEVYGDIDCQFEVIPEASGYLVVSKNAASQGCVGKFEMELLDTNYPDWKGDWSDLVVVSSEKSFSEICSAPTADQKATVDWIAKRSGFVLNLPDRNQDKACKNFSRALRVENLTTIESMASYESLTPEERLTKTRPSHRLALADKGLTDLSPLARFVGVDMLDLTNNTELVNISALKNLKALTDLKLARTAVQDFSPLFQHTNLKTLKLPANAVIACSAEITNQKIKDICK
ncbi:MAG TPA: hypothetical protein VE954_11110 [Oligoflexus sp.]|uniref:Ig-like domain-containing protein n=1 Tax=Oligoflexus sp. TaxID=1971216 RepID=UPI002D5CE4B8|nr:hypothetical protein [Oligoflexus sp.]HYX33655.1 hypothetical protein [Oligoflexus sp.]